MIRSEAEYREAVERVKAERARLKQSREKLRETLETAEVKRALAPQRTFLLQLQDEIDQYERLKRGEFNEIDNLRGLGELLIGLRIFQGLSQKELADRLGIHESQVSRDERNEYHNITIERASRILDVLGGDLRMIVRARAVGVV